MELDAALCHRELAEASQFLLDLKRDTKQFAEEDLDEILAMSARKGRKSLPRKDGASAWARSSSKRGIPVRGVSARVGEEAKAYADVVMAERRSAPAYSFPRAVSDAAAEETGPATALHPSIDAVSTTRRVPSARIAPPSPARRAPSEEERVSFPQDLPRAVRPRKAYSFGKEQRPPLVADQSALSGAPLDVLGALRAVRPRPASAAMGRPPAQRPDRAADASLERSEAAAAPRVDVLSHTVAAPAVLMRPDSSRRKVPLTCSSPGPAQYAAYASFAEGSAGGKVYFSDAETRAQSKQALAESRRPTPGPCTYDTSSADKHVAQRVPSSVDMSRAESKSLSTALAAKEYWESKARHAREEHDDMRATSLEGIRPKSPAATFAPRVYASKVLLAQPLSLMEEIDSLLGADAEPVAEVRYGLVDRRAQCGVAMERQASSQRSMQARVASRPALQMALVRGAERAVVYGPQLHVPWGEDRLAARRTGDDDLALHEVFPSLDAHAGDRASPYADAFLQSSLVGLRRNAVSFKRSEGRKEAPRETDKMDYLGPQVIVDWVEQSESRESRHKLNAISFDLSQGRDHLKIASKKLRRVIAFSEADDDESLIPGAYSSDKPFGVSAKGVPFSKLAKSAESDSEVEEFGNVLDLDVAAAEECMRTDRARSVSLYVKDRFEESASRSEGVEELDLGDRGFQHFADAALTRTTVVYSKMQGREDAELREEDEQLDFVVKDWKPMKASVPSVVFADPITLPRFTETDSPDEQLDLEPRYDYIKPKTVVSVNMAKQIAYRDEGKYEDSEVIDVGIALAVSEERDNLLNSAIDKRFTGARCIDLSKYAGHEELAQVREDWVLDLEPDDSMLRPNARNGVDMAKQQERGGIDKGFDDVEGDVLILSPRQDASAKYRRSRSGVSWKAQKERFSPKAADEPNEELVIEDVDPSLFKKGFKVKSAPAMSSQTGRATGRAEEDPSTANKDTRRSTRGRRESVEKKTQASALGVGLGSSAMNQSSAKPSVTAIPSQRDARLVEMLASASIGDSAVLEAPAPIEIAPSY